MRDVVVVAACRTPIGALNGQFKSLTAGDLSIPVMQELVKRASIDPILIEDVIWGQNYQRTYKENNVARVSAVKAGIPESVPGITIHRNCTSSFSAIQLGYYQIKAGEAECIMAGGADSMTTAPHMIFGLRQGKKFGDIQLHDSMWDSLTNLGIGPGMGITAENVAAKYGVTREMQDEMALRSQERAVAAIDAGKFKDEIVPITVHDKHKGDIVFDTDEYPKRGVTMEALAKLNPSFLDGGTVTAGNASGMNDAAAGLILMSEEKAKEVGAPILAKIIGTATTGVSPDYMGIGPVSSTQKALDRAGLTIKDIDLFEINEAFAAQCVAVQHELGIPAEKLNVNGSGISLGHPVGATGARISVTLLYELKRRGGKYGVAAACAGGGMGVTVIYEIV